MKNIQHILSLVVIILVLVVGVVGFKALSPQQTNASSPYTFAGTHLSYIFYDWQSWQNSTILKHDDAWAQTLRLMTEASPNLRGMQMTDINGDGLVDVLYYSRREYKQEWYFDAAVLVNTGGMKFDLAYKCTTLERGNGTNLVFSYSFFGDCAQQ
jgi:hypothetical protein